MNTWTASYATLFHFKSRICAAEIPGGLCSVFPMNVVGIKSKPFHFYKDARILIFEGKKFSNLKPLCQLLNTNTDVKKKSSPSQLVPCPQCKIEWTYSDYTIWVF